MRPAEEARAWRSVETAVRDLERLRTLMLDVLARDDQPLERERAFQPMPADPVHQHIESMCRAAGEAAKQATAALNIAKHVMADNPGAVRRQSVPDCLACGQLAQPRPRNGYCDACRKAWDRAGRPDRMAFEMSRRKRTDGGQS